MLLKLGVLLASVFGFLTALFLARKEGQRAEQVANLRREIERNAKEQEKANDIKNTVAGMSDERVSDILSNLPKSK